VAVLATGLFSTAALAQDEEAAGPRATLQLRYGAARHAGRQQLSTGALRYDDSVFNDLGVSGSYFTAQGQGPGLVFGMQQEGLTLASSEGVKQVTHAPLLRVHVGLAARFPLGPLRLQPSLGYALAQLPSVTALDEPRLLRAVRRSAQLGLRARLPLPRRLHAELRAELPFALFAIDGQGRRVTSSGVLAGVAVGRELARSGSVGSSLLLDYQYVYDRYTVDATRGAHQRISRLGLALELALWPKQGP
jgi:hypothetical protein